MANKNEEAATYENKYFKPETSSLAFTGDASKFSKQLASVSICQY